MGVARAGKLAADFVATTSRGQAIRHARGDPPATQRRLVGAHRHLRVAETRKPTDIGQFQVPGNKSSL